MALCTLGTMVSVMTWPAEPDLDPDRETDRPPVLVYEMGLSFKFLVNLMGDSDGLGPVMVSGGKN